jgi:hypothetical protein
MTKPISMRTLKLIEKELQTAIEADSHSIYLELQNDGRTLFVRVVPKPDIPEIRYKEILNKAKVIVSSIVPAANGFSSWMVVISKNNSTQICDAVHAEIL